MFRRSHLSLTYHVHAPPNPPVTPIYWHLIFHYMFSMFSVTICKEKVRWKSIEFPPKFSSSLVEKFVRKKSHLGSIGFPLYVTLYKINHVPFDDLQRESPQKIHRISPQVFLVPRREICTEKVPSRFHWISPAVFVFQITVWPGPRTLPAATRARSFVTGDMSLLKFIKSCVKKFNLI